MRKFIIVLLAIALLVVAFWVMQTLMNRRSFPAPQQRKIVNTVFIDTVKNEDIAITITANGNLQAKDRIELFSEVQGVFDHSSRDFKPGAWFEKGSIMLQINSDEHLANLRAQKSSLHNQIVLLLPDLRLDYPESFESWEKYVRDFDVNSPLVPLPEPISIKEKLFVSGRNILTPYYNITSLEERLKKYTITAPFSGVLTEAIVTQGTLIRQGQKLGEFISTYSYELEVAINLGYSELLQVGREVDLHNLENTKSWTGRVTRLNSQVDPSSQTVQVYIRLRGKDLKEGMYLEADLKAREEINTYELDRKLLVDETKLFHVRDSVLAMVEINPVYFKEKTVVVRGLADGMIILARPVPGAYAGMLVSPVPN